MKQLARELPSGLAHDAAAEQTHHDAVADKLQPMENLDATLCHDPP